MIFLTPLSFFLCVAILEKLEVRYGLIELCSPLLPPPTLQPCLWLWDLDSFSTLRWNRGCLFLQKMFYLVTAYYLFLCLALWLVPIIPTPREARTGGSPQFQGHLSHVTSSKTARPRERNSGPQATSPDTPVTNKQAQLWLVLNLVSQPEHPPTQWSLWCWGPFLRIPNNGRETRPAPWKLSRWVSINCQVYENPALMITQTETKMSWCKLFWQPCLDPCAAFFFQKDLTFSKQD